MDLDYLILVNKNHKIPENYIDGVELTEMRGYDGELFFAEKAAALQPRRPIQTS